MTEQTIKQTMMFYNLTREEAIERLNKTRAAVQEMSNNIKQSGAFKNDKVVLIK